MGKAWRIAGWLWAVMALGWCVASIVAEVKGSYAQAAFCAAWMAASTVMWRTW